MLGSGRTRPALRGVMPCVEAINEVHVSQPGLVVVDIAAADDRTAFTVQAALASMWATTAVERTPRDVGQPGVRLRCYLDMRQRPDT